jgi:hypothetical protein
MALDVTPAIADGGGAYVDFGRGPFMPGQHVLGRTSVSIPLARRGVIDQGPFYAYLVTGRRWPTPGRPLPAGAVRIGTFSFHHRRGARFDLTTRITIPEVRGDFYSVALCNDPCTVNGFTQPVTGYLSIVRTRREARLLAELQHRGTRIGDLRHELRTTKQELARASSTLAAVERDDARTNAEVSRLTDALAAERGRRAPLDLPAVAGCVALVLAAAAVTLWGRRRRRAASAARRGANAVRPIDNISRFSGTRSRV